MSESRRPAENVGITTPTRNPMKQTTILRRLLPPMAGAVAVITAVVMIAGALVMRGAVIEQTRVRARQLSSAEHTELEEMLRVNEHADMQPLIDGFSQMPDVAVARLLAPGGRIVASSRTEEVGTYAGAHAVQHDSLGDYMKDEGAPVFWRASVIHVARPLRNGGKCQSCHSGPPSAVLGVLDLDVAINPHLLGLTTFTGLSFLLGSLYLVAIMAIAVPRIRSVVVAPIHALTSAFRRVQEGDFTVAAVPSGTEEVDGVVDGFNRMVSRLRHAQAAEQEAHRLEMERAEQLAAVGQLAAGLAHEFRNPLSSVKAVVEVLAEEEDLGDARRTVLRQAAGELDRIDEIVRDLLLYARPKTPAVAPFDLNAVAKEVAELTLSAAAGNGVDVTFDLPAGPLTAVGDADLTRQVLLNLFLNARQAAIPGTTTRVDVSSGWREGSVWCRVRDHGPGVPSERAHVIFQPFETTKPRGTGLGLSISRRVMELQGGQLTLDNPGEAGAAFTFTLPAASGPRA